MISLIEGFLYATSWTFQKPESYSAPLLLFTAFGIVCAVFLARTAGVRYRSSGHQKRACCRFRSLLFFCGLVLAGCELYKQAFLYVVVFDHSYNWWYFPFQLCSIPMYLCLLLPLLPDGAIRWAVLTFLQDFGILGGIMALLVPDGFLWEYITLTIHGFLWHFLLIFIGFYIAFSRQSDNTKAGYLSSLPLYGICCLIATVINLSVQYFLWPYSYANMFYINPCFPSEQVVFRSIALTFGTPVGLISYLAASCIGAFIVHWFCGKIAPSSSTVIPEEIDSR